MLVSVFDIERFIPTILFLNYLSKSKSFQFCVPKERWARPYIRSYWTRIPPSSRTGLIELGYRPVRELD